VQSWVFGQAIRRWRDRLAPETVGVPAGDRRRAGGLHREEFVYKPPRRAGQRYRVTIDSSACGERHALLAQA
jgi:hypothetical protein